VLGRASHDGWVATVRSPEKASSGYAAPVGKTAHTNVHHRAPVGSSRRAIGSYGLRRPIPPTGRRSSGVGSSAFLGPTAVDPATRWWAQAPRQFVPMLRQPVAQVDKSAPRRATSQLSAAMRCRTTGALPPLRQREFRLRRPSPSLGGCTRESGRYGPRVRWIRNNELAPGTSERSPIAALPSRV